MTRPTRDETMMQMAEVMSSRGTCTRKQVGVVIARDGRVLATGYNGVPAGMPHCEHKSLSEKELWSLAWDFNVAIPGGQIQPYDKYYWSKAGTMTSVSTDPRCDFAVHAEVNTIAFAAKHGIRINRSDLYTTYSPCLACAKLIVNAGIRLVICKEAYHDLSGINLLREAGVLVECE